MKARKNEIEIFKYFITLAEYDRRKNIFRWRFGKYKGQRCGRIHDSGYWIIRFTMNGDETHVYEHRIIYWIHFADFHDRRCKWNPHQLGPIKQIDHINGIKTDNRPENLRSVTPGQNSRNAKIHRAGHLANTTKVSKKWRSQITIRGEHIHLGYFDTQKEAHRAAQKALKHS